MSAPPRMNSSASNPMFNQPGLPPGQYLPPTQAPQGMQPQTPPKFQGQPGYGPAPGQPGGVPPAAYNAMSPANNQYNGAPPARYGQPAASFSPGQGPPGALGMPHHPNAHMNRTPPPPSAMPLSSENLPRNYSAPAMSNAGIVNGARHNVSQMNGPPSAGAPTSGPPSVGPPGMTQRPLFGAPPGVRPPGPGAPRPGPPSWPAGPVGPPPARPPFGPPPTQAPGQRPPSSQPPAPGPPLMGDGPLQPQGPPPAALGQGHNYSHGGGPNGPQTLPTPFHGQAQYSHQLHDNNAGSQGATPSGSAGPSQRSSVNPSPVNGLHYDSMEGQFSPEAGPVTQQQYGSQASPHSPPAPPMQQPAGITGRRQYPQMPGIQSPAIPPTGPVTSQPGQTYTQGPTGSVPGQYPQQPQPGGPYQPPNNAQPNYAQPNNLAAQLGSDFAGLSMHESRPVNLLQERHLIPTTGVENAKPNLPHDFKKVNCNPE